MKSYTKRERAGSSERYAFCPSVQSDRNTMLIFFFFFFFYHVCSIYFILFRVTLAPWFHCLFLVTEIRNNYPYLYNDLALPLDTWWSTGPQQQLFIALDSVPSSWLRHILSLLSFFFGFNVTKSSVNQLFSYQSEVSVPLGTRRHENGTDYSGIMGKMSSGHFIWKKFAFRNLVCILCITFFCLFVCTPPSPRSVSNFLIS